jgi:hypothetical protein
LRRLRPAAVLLPLPDRRRRRRSARARTLRLALAAGSASCALAAGELARVWRRGSAPNPSRPAELLTGGRVAAAETVAVIRAGYRAGSANETAVLNLFLAFGTTFAATRAVTHSIRAGVGPWRNVVIGRRHVHHFVPGMLLAFLAGGASIVLRREDADPWLAVPFGGGLALVLDESALLLELEDVYWSEQGLVSVQIALGSLTLLAALALGVRLLRRGEQRVLPPAPPPSS